MSARYYAGKWNEHEIVLVNGDAEQLLIDGKMAAKNKAGIHLSIELTGEIPMEDGLFVFIHWEGGNCACIVGKPLEASYDKETKTFFTEYEGHKLEANNKKLKGKLIVDGAETDKEDGMFNTYTILGSKPDENGKRFMAVLSDGVLKLNCRFFAQAENVRMYPCQKQGGELIPIYRNDIDEGFAVGFMLGASID